MLVPRAIRDGRTRTSRPCRTGACGRCRACPGPRRRPRGGSTTRRRRSAAAASPRRGSRPCAARRARPRTCRPGTGRRERGRASRPARGRRGRSPCRTSACSRTSTGGIVGRKPLAPRASRASTARARGAAARGRRAGRRSASPTCARRARCRSAGPRAPGGRAARSRTPASLPPTATVTPSSSVMPSAADGCGMFGQLEQQAVEPAPRPRRARRRARRGASPSPAACACSAAASRPARFASPIACDARLRSARSSSACGLQRAALLVERQQLVERSVGVAPRERRAHALGVGSDQAEIEHAPILDGLTRRASSYDLLEELRDAVRR